MVKLQEATSEIAIAAQEFYKALHAMFEGDATHMEHIWSHADDVTYLGPQGGILVGWNPVYEALKKQARLKLKGNLTLQDVHVIQEGNIGMMQCLEVGTNVMHGQSEQVRIRALSIFRKENGKWKMISHQTDLLPFLQSI